MVKRRAERMNNFARGAARRWTEVLTMAEYVKLKDTILEGVFGWCESAEE